jgi:hypothetical protein
MMDMLINLQNKQLDRKRYSSCPQEEGLPPARETKHVAFERRSTFFNWPNHSMINTLSMH